MECREFPAFKVEKGSSTRSTIAVLAVSLILLSISFMIPGSEAAVGPSAVETRLYLHNNPLRLDTIPPQQSTELIGILTAGQSLEYTLTFPLTGDLDIGALGSGGILLHLDGVMVNPLSDNLVLTVEVYEDTTSSSSLLMASGEFDQSAISGGDMLLNLQRTSLGTGSTVRLVLSLEGGGTIPGFQFSYQSISDTGSFLSFGCDAMPEEDLWLRMERADGSEIEEILPNGPPETREVHFKTRVKDLFGAYDVESVTVSMIGPGDSYIFNQTGTPSPGGGQEYTYFNFTGQIDPIPSGTYDISMRASSHTGKVSYLNTTLEVAAGLFLTLPDPGPRQVDAGEQAFFDIDVLNGGSSTDLVSFSGSTASGWNIISPGPIEIEPGEEGPVRFTVDVPFTASSGHNEEVVLEARSRNADRTYVLEGVVEVMEQANFGLSMKSPYEVSLFSGMSANFTMQLTNLMNDTETFELWLEGLPSGWSFDLQASGGQVSGSRYEVSLEGTSSTMIALIIEVPNSDQGGRYNFKVNCKQVAKSDVRSLSLEMLVVDDSFPPFSLSDGTGKELSERIGYGFPVAYQQVSFYLAIYNPTLEGRTVELLAEGPDGWGLELDAAPFDLGGGEREDRILRVTPFQGEMWKEDGYSIDVVAYLGAGSKETLELTVELEKVRSILLEPESSTISGCSSDVISMNFTVTNRGNVDESLTITFLPDEGLTVNRTEVGLALESGQSHEVKCSLELGSVSEEKVLKVTISAEVQNGPKVTSDVQVKVRPGDAQKGGIMDYLIWALLAIAVVVLAVAGYFIYTRRSRGRMEAPDKKDKKDDFKEVSISTEPDRRARPLRAPERKKVLNDADRLAAQLLEEDEGVVTMKVEAVEVVDARTRE